MDKYSLTVYDNEGNLVLNKKINSSIKININPDELVKKPSKDDPKPDNEVQPDQAVIAEETTPAPKPIRAAKPKRRQKPKPTAKTVDYGPIVADDIGRQDKEQSPTITVEKTPEPEPLNLDEIHPSVPVRQPTPEPNVEQSTHRPGWFKNLPGWVKVAMVLFIFGLFNTCTGCCLFTFVIPILFGNH